MADFNNIKDMAERFLSAKRHGETALDRLDTVEFFALIYCLCTGSFEIVGFSTKGFLRYFTILRGDENLPLRIINDLTYDKNDFIEEVNNQLK